MDEGVFNTPVETYSSDLVELVMGSMWDTTNPRCLLGSTASLVLTTIIRSVFYRLTISPSFVFHTDTPTLPCLFSFIDFLHQQDVL